MIGLLELVKDPYERKARVTPGLLVALPLMIPLLAVYGPKHPILTSILALLGGCGAIFGLANIARGLGKRLEEGLVVKWGGMPTTIALRHRDNFFDSVSKKRYHEAIEQKLEIKLPTAQQEAADPAGADDVYIGASRRLRELTRSDKQLLLKENIAYGFHRNMLALKPIGIVTSSASCVYALSIANVISPVPPYFSPAQLLGLGLASGVTLLVSIALLAAWLFYFNATAVQRIGFAYAERLFECLHAVKAPSRKRAPK